MSIFTDAEIAYLTSERRLARIATVGRDGKPHVAPVGWSIDREREVIEMRYGLKGHQARTLEEVGRAFGVTRERIRQIENNTLKKLEHLPEAQRLREAS